jgi:hypothetical protein
MQSRSLIWLPVLAQFGAVAVLVWGRQPYGLYAQLVSSAVMLVVGGVLGIRRFQFLRRNYKDIKRRRDEHAAAFRSFIDAHPPPNPHR